MQHIRSANSGLYAIGSPWEASLLGCQEWLFMTGFFFCKAQMKFCPLGITKTKGK